MFAQNKRRRAVVRLNINAFVEKRKTFERFCDFSENIYIRGALYTYPFLWELRQRRNEFAI